MSEKKASLSDLRNFRPNKALANGSAEKVSNGVSNKLANGRKRIRAMSDSSGDEAQPQKPSGNQMNDDLSTIKQREHKLQALRRLCGPTIDFMVLQDALVHNDWDVEKARLSVPVEQRRVATPATAPLASPPRSVQNQIGSVGQTNNTPNAAQPVTNSSSTLSMATTISAQSSNLSNITQSSIISSTTQIDTPSSSQSSISSNPAVLASMHTTPTVTVHKPQSRRRRNSSGGGSDDGDNYGRGATKVYDSDDESDDETSFVMTKDRKRVLEFLNTATSGELMVVKSLSAKKIDVLLPLRPFTDWTDLLKKIETNKMITTEMLNACQELLDQRKNMNRIMQKCQKLTHRLETAAGKDNVVKQPPSLNEAFKLADYQLIGLNWMVILHSQNMNGILADEMGLGKTIQVIAFLAHLKETGKSKATHLIVVPSSTLDNWENELSKWCPALVVEKYYGSMSERRSLRIRYAKEGLTGIDVLLTTYNMVAASKEEKKMFKTIKIHYAVFDEAHMLKNMTTERYSRLTLINAERRLLLTGTPLQNSLLELMSLLCFVMPDMFKNRTDDIKNLFQKTKQIKGEELTTFERTQIEQAKLIMKPFVLRRLKDDVLKFLPEKKDAPIRITMSESQKEKYEELVQTYSSDDGIVKATHEFSGISIMMDMRKLANHPLLLRYYYTDAMVHKVAAELAKHPLYKKNPNPQYVFEELAPLSDFQLYQTIEKYELSQPDIPNRLIVDSGKFRELDRLLPKLKREGHRVLIFSQFTMMLDVLEKYLDIREHKYLRFDGQTAVVERQEIIDQYIRDPSILVFLLSTKAGGLGINLIAADTVIIHDIDFNPYNDKQAEDRCHRMGQTKPVTIYRFITDGTIEEGMAMVAKEKLNLEREVTADSGDSEDGEEKEVDHKCMVRLLTMALGIKDENKVEQMISPAKKMST